MPTTDIRVLDLEPGHVIAVPFAGYGDLLAEITNTERRGYLLDVTVREPDGFSYTTVLPAEPDDVTIRTYPAEAAGTWQQ